MTITRIIKGPYRFAGFFWVDVECDGKVPAPDAQHREAGQCHCRWAGGGMTYLVYFAPQYGNQGRWAECTVDAFGTWRCNGMYMPAPTADRIKEAA